MAEPVLTEHPAPPDPRPNTNPSMEEFDSLPIPPLDTLFFSSTNTDQDFVSDLPFTLDDNYDFNIDLDDLEGLDDFYFPSETEPFLVPDNTVNPLNSGSAEGLTGNFITNSSNSGSPESGSSGISGDRGSDVSKYLNCPPSEAVSSDSSQGLNFSSPASSQGSGNGVGSLSVSGVSEGMNAASPNSENFVVDQKIKIEEVGNAKIGGGGVSKRKKEASEETICERTRNQKYLRAENVNPNMHMSDENLQLSEEEEKKKARLMRNRESAQLSRQRKKHYVEELEEKVKAMHSTIAELNGKISFFMAENATLRQQLSGGNNGMCLPPPPPHMYLPMAPVAYPWVPCAPYVVKPSGSHIPLVPIPRLKPQQPAPAPKAKKVEPKKGESKTKRVASVSFLGLLFFVLLFGGLVPIVDVKFGGIRENGVHGSFYDQHRGRVLIVNGHSNGSRENVGTGFSDGRFDIGNTIHCVRGQHGCSEYDAEKKGVSEHLPGPDQFVHPGNASEPLVASLYVPRNDKLVKIDGNLIIHSVLASERAMASHETPEVNNTKETGLAIPRDFSPALAIPDVGSNKGRHATLYHTPAEQQKALTSGSADTVKDHLKSSAANGRLQQWFHEGLAGPLLSSGMCTEVFQFDVSPAPGAIVRTSPITNNTSEQRRNNTYLNKGKNRRILRGLPIPLAGSDFNATGERVGRDFQKDNFQGNKSLSSMVVSVLVDPREARDSEVEGVIKPKSLSRIFVVVLLDSVKYATYSCVLPRAGHHLVMT